MSDRLEKLRGTLRQLETELAALGTLADATREQLAAACEEMAASLRRGKGASPSVTSDDSLQDRLADFEASHPQLAGVVTRMLDGLAQLGI